MAEHKFQWSIFTDHLHTEQYVIRCDDLAEFLEAMELIRSFLVRPSSQDNTSNGHTPEQEPEIPPDQCSIHNQSMKLRTSKHGKQWYDHRWEVDGIWHLCNGKHERVQSPSSNN